MLAGVASVANGQTPATDRQRFAGEIEVSRVLLDARVLTRRGQPVLGLQPGDFTVRIDNTLVPVESVAWVSGEPAPAEVPGPAQGATGDAPAGVPGRLVVLFFQCDFQHARLTGLFRIAPKARELVASLRPQDRVAVLSFDSHLKLQLDFTNDRAALARILTPTALLRDPPLPPPGPFPSLARGFDTAAARRAASPEAGLLVTARALEQLPGPKTVVLFGWGLGHMAGRAGVRADASYGPARRALTHARVAVFSLDITDADYHTLEVGLERVAEDTGGFYVKTHLFPDTAIARMEGALSGYYVLTIQKPSAPHGLHAVAVGLTHEHGAQVLAKNSFQD
ncbi:MAG: VWA domain-containing protein [Acidobacteriota bacterium]